MSTYVLVWLGGCVSAALSDLTDERYWTISRQTNWLKRISFLFVRSALWPISVLSPLVTRLLVRSGYGGLVKVQCVTCGASGVGIEKPYCVSPPDAWWVTGRVVIACSSGCAQEFVRQNNATCECHAEDRFHPLQ